MLKSLNAQHFQLPALYCFSVQPQCYRQKTVIPGLLSQSTSQGSTMSAQGELPYETPPQTLHRAWTYSTWKLVGSCPSPRAQDRPQRWRTHCCSSTSCVFFYLLLASDFQAMKCLQNLVPTRYLPRGHLPRHLFVTGSVRLRCCKNNSE